jgi:hypothetical protein
MTCREALPFKSLDDGWIKVTLPASFKKVSLAPRLASTGLLFFREKVESYESGVYWRQFQDRRDDDAVRPPALA